MFVVTFEWTPNPNYKFVAISFGWVGFGTDHCLQTKPISYVWKLGFVAIQRFRGHDGSVLQNEIVLPMQRRSRDPCDGVL